MTYNLIRIIRSATNYDAIFSGGLQEQSADIQLTAQDTELPHYNVATGRVPRRYAV